MCTNLFYFELNAYYAKNDKTKKVLPYIIYGLKTYINIY